jgi:hypothetical protein
MAKTPRIELTGQQLTELLLKIKAVGTRTRPSKAALRKQLKSSDRTTRMKAYKFLRYRLKHGLR